jgi:hypothetical protein
MTTYTFIDGEKTFVVQCKPKDGAQEARVTEIWDKNTPILQWSKTTDDEDEKPEIDIYAVWTPKSQHIVLEDVYFNTGKREGHCTKTTAYLIKSLLLQAKKADKDIKTAEVMLVSDDYCAASNCYIHAFMLNNFQVDQNDVVGFQTLVNQLEEENRSVLTQTFHFYNKNFTHEIKETKQQQITKKCKLNELKNYKITPLSDPVDNNGPKKKRKRNYFELKF